MNVVHAFHCAAGLVGIIVRDSGVQCFAALHDIIQRAHCLFDRSAVVGSVVVENVNVVEVHSLQRLVYACDEVFSAAVVAVGSLPHIVSGFCGDDKLVAVLMPVASDVFAKIALSFTVWRSVVVREVEMCDSVVECRAEYLLLCAERCYVSEVVPKSERYCRELESASSASSVGHFVVPCLCGSVGNVLFVAHFVILEFFLHFITVSQLRQGGGIIFCEFSIFLCNTEKIMV